MSTKLYPVKDLILVKNDKGEPIPGAKIVFSFKPVGGIEREKPLIGPNYHGERADDSGHWTNSEIPADFHSPIEYVAAICKSSKQQDTAGKFLQFIFEPNQRALLSKLGFELTPPVGSKP